MTSLDEGHGRMCVCVGMCVCMEEEVMNEERGRLSVRMCVFV